MEMNERFRAVRKDKGLTQSEMADDLGCSRNVIKNIELNLSPPSGTMINLVCKTYSVNEIWLRTGQGGMYSDDPKQDEFLAKIGDYASEAADQRKKVIISHVMSMLDKVPDEFFEYFAESLIEIAKELREAKDQNDGE